MNVEIHVPGEPVPKARPRVTFHGTYTPERTKRYEELVQWCWVQQSGYRYPDDQPLSVSVIAKYAMPKSWSKKKREELRGTPRIFKPDIDNVIKAATDALIDHAYKDDSRIIHVQGVKVWSDESELIIYINDDGAEWLTGCPKKILDQ